MKTSKINELKNFKDTAHGIDQNRWKIVQNFNYDFSNDV